MLHCEHAVARMDPDPWELMTALCTEDVAHQPPVAGELFPGAPLGVQASKVPGSTRSKTPRSADDLAADLLGERTDAEERPAHPQTGKLNTTWTQPQA